MFKVAYDYSLKSKKIISFFLILTTTTVSNLEPAQAKTTPKLEYVALGDSYASGIGIDDNADKLCRRSENNFAHQLAGEFNLTLKDKSCAAATSDNLVWSEQKIGKKRIPLQAEALTPETDIVSISIGGNDMKFADIAAQCVAKSASGNLLKHPLTTNCEKLLHNYDSNDVFNKIDEVMSKLENTYTIIRAKAPNAKVFVLGYPALMPDTANTPDGGCFRPFLNFFPLSVKRNSFPFTDNDVQFLHSLEVTFDQALAKTVEKFGFNYVSQLASSIAATSCVADPGARFSNDIMFSWTANFSDFYVLDHSLHPNISGHTHTANLLRPELQKIQNEHVK